MKAVLTHAPFSDTDWIYERKLDGMRVVARKDGNRVQLFSRNHKELSRTYPELIEPLQDLRSSWWLDGEIVTYEDGLTSFRKLQERMHIKNRQEALRSNVDVFLYFFDCMYVDCYDLRNLPLRYRKKILREYFRFHDPVRLLEWRNQSGRTYLEEACAQGWEGLIAKNIKSTYLSKRSDQWKKLKCHNEQELVIVGYTAPQGRRTHFGALLLGYYYGDKLRYAGKVGTGFDEDTRGMLLSKLAHKEMQRPPLSQGNVKEKDVTWVRPELVAQVGFTEWTRNGKLRHPRYLGMRDDKEPSEVVKEEV